MKSSLNRYDPQVRADAKKYSLKGFINMYKMYHSEKELTLIYKDILNEPEEEIRHAIAHHTDEATDFPEFPPLNKEREEESLKTIVYQTNEAMYDMPELPDICPSDSSKSPFSPPTISSPTRASRMKELIQEGKEKTEVKRIMEEEGFEFKGSVFHSEYRRLTK